MSYKNIPRLYINKALKSDLEILLEVKDTHYLRNVLRLKDKNKLRVFNGVDGEWEALILDRFCKKIKCVKKNKEQSFTEGPCLYFSLIKGHNLRWLLEKATELGVKELQPIITDRVNIRSFNYQKAVTHLKESSQVSERLDLPKLYQLKTLKEALLELKNKSQKAIFCNESRNDVYLSNYLTNNFSKKISFIVGPEGGFSDKEIKFIKAQPNIQSVKIHDRILRAETAVVLIISIYKNFLITESKVN